MHKLYVLIRKDQSLGQIAIQGGHAVAEFCKLFPESEWQHRTLVYLEVDNEYELKDYKDKFFLVAKECAPYYEAWLKKHPFTALAVLGTPEVEEMVKKLKLIFS